MYTVNAITSSDFEETIMEKIGGDCQSLHEAHLHIKDDMAAKVASLICSGDYTIHGENQIEQKTTEFGAELTDTFGTFKTSWYILGGNHTRVIIGEHNV